MSLAQHSYSDYVKDDGGRVGIIVAERGVRLNKRFTIDWFQGSRAEHDYNVALITEHEYYAVVDPARCGKDIPALIAEVSARTQEDYFTGGVYRNTIVKRKDLFND